MNYFTNRDKTILIGLYLSKFDIEALNSFGFQGFNEAFNTLGYSIGSKPASIKNYRDEFDPFFPNNRKGWHNRPIRDYCKKILDEFKSLGLETFTELIKSFVIKNYDIEKIIEKRNRSESVAKRLMTGVAAEEYFKANYRTINYFSNFELVDTTNLACGFDFKLSFEINFYCIEVKGVNTNNGSILMTEKEFSVAKYLKEKYCLFIVTNFFDKPIHQFYFDPINSSLKFKKREQKVIQINYTATI